MRVTDLPRDTELIAQSDRKLPFSYLSSLLECSLDNGKRTFNGLTANAVLGFCTGHSLRRTSYSTRPPPSQ